MRRDNGFEDWGFFKFYYTLYLPLVSRSMGLYKKTEHLPEKILV